MKNTLFLSAMLTAVLMAGCNSASTDAASTDKKDTVATTNPTGTINEDAKGVAAEVPGVQNPAPVKGEPGKTPEKGEPGKSPDPAKPDPKTGGKSASMDKPNGKDSFDTEKMGDTSDPRVIHQNDEVVAVKDPGSERPKTDPRMAEADKLMNKGASLATFAGTYERYVDPKILAKYPEVIKKLGPKGKDFKIPNSVITINGDGTFTWHDVGGLVDRTVTGTVSVKGGVASFKVSKVTGYPTMNDGDRDGFTAIMLKDGKFMRNKLQRFDRK